MTFVLAVVIIIVVGMLLIVQFRPDTPSAPPVAPSDFDAVGNYLQLCLEQAADAALLRIGLNGGYRHIDGVYFSSDEGDVALYYYNNLTHIPSIGRIEDEISSTTLDEFFSCVGTFEEFPEASATLLAEPSARAIITSGEVIIKVDPQIEITISNTTRQYFSVTVQPKVDFLKLYRAAEQVVHEVEQSPRLLPLSALLSIATANGLTIDTLEYNETVIIGIRDALTDSAREPSLLVFAVLLSPDATVLVENEDV